MCIKRTDRFLNQIVQPRFEKNLQLQREIVHYFGMYDLVISLSPAFPFSIRPICLQRHFPLCVSKFTRPLSLPSFYFVSLSSVLFFQLFLVFALSFFLYVLHYGCFLPLLTSLYDLLRARHSLFLSENTIQRFRLLLQFFSCSLSLLLLHRYRNL